MPTKNVSASKKAVSKDEKTAAKVVPTKDTNAKNDIKKPEPKKAETVKQQIIPTVPAKKAPVPIVAKKAPEPKKEAPKKNIPVKKEEPKAAVKPVAKPAPAALAKKTENAKPAAKTAPAAPVKKTETAKPAAKHVSVTPAKKSPVKETPLKKETPKPVVKETPIKKETPKPVVKETPKVAKKPELKSTSKAKPKVAEKEVKKPEVKTESKASKKTEPKPETIIAKPLEPETVTQPEEQPVVIEKVPERKPAKQKAAEKRLLEEEEKIQQEEQKAAETAYIPKTAVRYSDEDLDLFRIRINDVRREALEELGMLKERLEDLTNYDFAEESMIYSMHMAEQGSEAMEKEKTYAQIQRINEYIKKLDEALQRITDKTYGICRVCKCLIAKERLLAVPITTLSASYKIHRKCPDDGVDRIEPLK